VTDVDHPILDDHIHLDPRNGDGIEAVEQFVRSGGTHLCLVNKPSWTLGVEATEPADFDAVFEETLAVADRARDVVPGDVYPVLGVHPGLVSRLVERVAVEDAVALMRGGLERAAERVDDGTAVALKSGRPHYDVDDDVWEGSNDVMRHAFRLAADRDCAVQLHTESGTDFEDVGAMAVDGGMDPDRVVKHYAEPGTASVRPSLLAREEWIREAAEADERFTLETDFVDDPERPGAVLGPRTVPRRVRALHEDYPEAIHDACVALPEEIYDVEIALD
jgi:TatD-related deoxyribonuclease